MNISKIYNGFLWLMITYLLILTGCGNYQQQTVKANKPVGIYQINYESDTKTLSIKSIDVTPPYAGYNYTGIAGLFQSGPTTLNGNLVTAPVYIVNNSLSSWTGVEMQMYKLLTGSSVLAAFPDFGTGWYTDNPSYGAWGWLFTTGTAGNTYTIPAGGKSANKVIGFNANSNFAAWAYIYANVPIITGINPLGALAGQPVTISGYNFSSTSGSVTFNGVNATVTSWSPTSIVATVPTNVTLGDVFVETVDPNTPYSNGVIFTPYKIFASSVASPYGITVDTVGNLYVASNSTNYIVKITPAGVVSNYSKKAGTGTLNVPMDVAMDPSGNGTLYVPSCKNNFVATVNSSGTVSKFSSTFGNCLSALYFSDAGQSWPLYVTSERTGAVYSVSSTGVPTLFASGFTNLTAITVDASGNVYVGECSNGSVYRIDPTGTVITRVVTGLTCPTCMKQDQNGNIYILDNTTTSTMYKYNPNTGNLSFYVAGNGITYANGGFAFSPDFSLLYVGQTAPINDVTVIPLK
ncbi:MAG: IPT/TIG domain-containing protein [bacterium]